MPTSSERADLLVGGYTTTERNRDARFREPRCTGPKTRSESWQQAPRPNNLLLISQRNAGLCCARCNVTELATWLAEVCTGPLLESTLFSLPSEKSGGQNGIDARAFNQLRNMQLAAGLEVAANRCLRSRSPERRGRPGQRHAGRPRRRRQSASRRAPANPRSRGLC